MSTIKIETNIIVNAAIYSYHNPYAEVTYWEADCPTYPFTGYLHMIRLRSDENKIEIYSEVPQNDQ